jgi:uncharacterized protein (DUF2267 family)
VKYDVFVDRVAERAGLADRGEAERTAVVVLQELSDRITGDEGWDLFAQLPAQLKTAVIISPAALPLSAEEFIERVARELELSPEEAHSRVRAVFGALREAVTWGELEDVLAQLDPEYADLLA